MNDESIADWEVLSKRQYALIKILKEIIVHTYLSHSYEPCARCKKLSLKTTELSEKLVECIPQDERNGEKNK